MLLSSFIEVLAQFAVRTPRVEAGDSELFSSSGGASSRVAVGGSESFQVVTVNSGSLLSCHRGSGSFRVVAVNSGFLSSCSSGLVDPLELWRLLIFLLSTAHNSEFLLTCHARLILS